MTKFFITEHFFKREGRHCIESLKDVVVEKKRDLENVTGELKLAQSQIAELFENALTRINMLKKHLVHMSKTARFPPPPTYDVFFKMP